MVAEPLVHGCVAAGELRLLLYHGDVVHLLGLGSRLGGDDLLLHDLLVEVVGTLGDVYSTGLGFVFGHLFLSLHFLGLVKFLVFDDEEVGDTLLVGNFLGLDDFFGFFKVHLLFLDFLLDYFLGGKGRELLFGGCVGAFFLGA